MDVVDVASPTSVVADGWAGAEMRFSTILDYKDTEGGTDTDGSTNGRVDTAS